MSILTSRELEFLASLNTNWWRLYFDELARLLKEDDGSAAIASLRVVSTKTTRPANHLRLASCDVQPLTQKYSA
jgi:hypothetical protein